ncbi:MAG: cytosine permease [Lewinella sp.]
MTENKSFTDISTMDEEQLPIPRHKLHGWLHFLGIYAGEHVAATEFVIGATFVALGATTRDILLGLLIGNLLAILSWTLITSPIAVDTRLSLYTYLNKIAGDSMTKLYNWANVVIFTVISAAMITVSSTAVRFLFDIPAQLNWYPTNAWFVLIVLIVGAIVVFVAMYGFNAVADFSSICAPWLFVMFTCGALVLLPELTNSVVGHTTIAGWDEFLLIGDQSIWTGINSDGEPGIGLLEVIGFAWAANTLTHFGLIDMALFRYAKKKSYGLTTSSGMLFGHYIAWISAGIMGAGAAVLLQKTIVELDPGDVAYYALGMSGFVIVIVAGWTTANANLYRAGLAAQAIFTQYSRQRTTLVVGICTVIVACFPFVFSQILPLLTYAGLLVVPVGGIVFAEHVLFPKLGMTRYWLGYKGLNDSVPAIAAWAVGLIFGFGLNALEVISFYYLFLPTWVVTMAVYILMAKRYGAAERYPEAEATAHELDERIEAHQTKQADEATEVVADVSALSKLLLILAGASLLLILVLGLLTMFRSPDMATYEANRALFYRYAFIGTLVYFVSAYWRLQRGKKLYPPQA